MDEGHASSFDELKSRVILSLEKLGQQQFSPEPGGYGFENWLQSFNLLLDDFEDRSPREKLPNEYFEKRKEITESLLVKPIDTSDIQKQIENLRDEERSLTLKALDRGLVVPEKKPQKKTLPADNTSLHSMKQERSQYKEELESKKALLEEKAGQKKSGFFKRIFGGSGPDEIGPIQKRIRILESRISDLDSRIERAEGTSQEKPQTQSTGDSELDQVRTKIAELESYKLERMQSQEKRQLATGEMSKVISSIKIEEEVQPQEIVQQTATTSEKIGGDEQKENPLPDVQNR